ncbi:MAG: hypothetical protein MUP61_00915, partial [Burkholderiales bacterium]|nr:hypothetical protein [Burkholderiales bacterium]
VAPSVTISGSVDSADDVGVIADTISLASGSSTSATHDVILAAANITATSATVSADHDISAAVTGDLRLNSSGFTAGNDIFINMLGATSTLYLNEVSGLQEASFLWAQAPSTIFLTYSARESGGLVVDGVATDAFTYVSTAGGSGLFYGPEKHPAVPGDGLQLTFAGGLPPVDGTPVDPTVLSAVIAAVNATATSTVERAGTLPGTFDTDFGTLGSLGGSDDSIGGTEGSFGGDEEDENKTDEGTGLKKKADKPTKKKLSTCS